MDRRIFILTSLAAAPTMVWSHHGWSSFDQDRPIYLEGQVLKSVWQNPHVELVIALNADLKLPANLAQRAIPAQTAPVDGRAILGKTVLPSRSDRQWDVELAPLSRMQAWNVKEIKAGDAVALVGFTFKGEQGKPIVRCEYLFFEGNTYGLRSGPA